MADKKSAVWGKLDRASYDFLLGQTYNLTLKNGRMANPKKALLHGMGHYPGSVNGSIGGFILMSLIILVMITLYMAFKIYK